MVQFPSINLFCWISSIFVGFFKSSRFFVSLYKARPDTVLEVQQAMYSRTPSLRFIWWKSFLCHTLRKTLNEVYDSHNGKLLLWLQHYNHSSI